MEKNFMYDSFSDRLFISNKRDKDKVAGSIKYLNLTIDINTDNQIVNIELKKASDFLSSLKISPSILENLKKAEIGKSRIIKTFIKEHSI